MLFMSKQKKVESQLADYNQKVSDCVSGFHDAIRNYCETSDRKKLEEDFQKVYRAESLADDIRRAVEVMMYTKSIFPESRGDILGMLEAMDKVPNQCEATLRMLLTHHLEIPKILRPGIIHLANVCHKAVEALLEASGRLFQDFTTATVAVGKVDQLESEADEIEAALTDQIFSGQQDTQSGWEKILTRDLVRYLGAVSDRAENAGDRIRIIVAKRSI